MLTPLTLVIGNKNYSSWSLRPWLVLQQAGIVFEELRIPLRTPTSTAALKQYSPSGKVPALIFKDLVLWESLAICEFIAEQFAPTLWPVDPTMRAIARSVSHEMHGGFFALRQHLPMDCRTRHKPRIWPQDVQQDIDRVLQLWQSCRQQYGAQGAFLFGDFSIADAMFAPVVSRFVTYAVPLDEICQTYANVVWELPAMQEWLIAAEQETEVIENP